MGAGLWPHRASLGARGRLCAGLCHWRWLGCHLGGMVVVMTKDEALRLALEALERVNVVDDDCDILAPSLADVVVEAITAVKAALEAKDEPLVYLPPTASPDNACYTQPQRKPLTNEEISLIDWESLVTKKDCVRAIEAAHGIKEEA